LVEIQRYRESDGRFAGSFLTTSMVVWYSITC
jgi:hypothetical protein